MQTYESGDWECFRNPAFKGEYVQGKFQLFSPNRDVLCEIAKDEVESGYLAL